MQFYAFEVFEKIYYKFEERYMVARERLQNTPFINIFNPSTYKLTFPKEELTSGSDKQQEEAFYNEDEYGFRSWNIDYNIKNGKRFMFVGSVSMGYGFGVPVDKNFPSVFYKRLKELRPSNIFEVINSNRGQLFLSQTFYELKKMFYSKTSPDIVILGTYTPKFGYPRNSGQSLEERVFGNKSKQIQDIKVIRKNTILSPRMEHSGLWYDLQMSSLLMAKLLTYLDIQMYETICSLSKCKDDDTDYTGYINDLHEFLSQRGIPLLVVELVSRETEYAQKVNVVNKRVRETCAELGIPFLSIAELRPMWSYTWVAAHHYSVKSNQLIGSDIAKWVDDILDDDFQIQVNAQENISK
jgi:hypothetical protein